MAILLKAVSVRVSSIQIIQVRVQNKGKSVWKSRYDGGVSAVHRLLRPSVSVARCLSASPVAHRCHPSNSAIRRPSFAPLTILGMLLLWCPFQIGLCLIVARAMFTWTSWGWPRRHSTLRPWRQYTGIVPFGLGGVMSFGFSSGTPVSPHELGYPTPFVRASDVSLRAVVLVPVIFSLGLFVVLCRWWYELLCGARSGGVGFRGLRFGLCNQPSLPFLSFFLLVLGYPLGCLPL